MRHEVASLNNCIGPGFFEIPQLPVGKSAGFLDLREGGNERSRYGASGDGKVFRRPRGMNAPRRIGWNLPFAKKIFFGSGFHNVIHSLHEFRR